MKTTTLTEDATASELFTISASMPARTGNQALAIAREALNESDYSGERPEEDWKVSGDERDLEYVVTFEKADSPTVVVKVRKFVLEIGAVGTAISDKHAQNIAKAAASEAPETREIYPRGYWQDKTEEMDGEYWVHFTEGGWDKRDRRVIAVRVLKHVEGEKFSPASLRAIPTYHDGSGAYEQTIRWMMDHLAEDEEIARRLRRFIQANYERMAGLNVSASRWASKDKWKGKPQIEISCSNFRGVKSSPDEIADLWPDLTWTRMVEDYPGPDKIHFHWAAELEEVWIVLKNAEMQILRPAIPQDGQVVRRASRKVVAA